MLNNIGLPGLLLIAVVVLVLFGRGKISSLMGEVGKGITAFKRGVKDGTAEAAENEDQAVARDPAQLEPGHPAPAAAAAEGPGQRHGTEVEAARDVTPGAARQGEKA